MLFHNTAVVSTIGHDMADDHETDAAEKAVDHRTAQRRAIGERILKRRKELLLTQHELGLRTQKISGNEISRWERGQNKPSGENLELLAQALGVEQGYLLFGNAPSGSAAAALSSREIVTELQNIGAQLGELVGVLRGQAPGIETLVADALKTLGVDPAALPHTAGESPSLAPPAPPSRSSRRRAGGR